MTQSLPCRRRRAQLRRQRQGAARRRVRAHLDPAGRRRCRRRARRRAGGLSPAPSAQPRASNGGSTRCRAPISGRRSRRTRSSARLAGARRAFTTSVDEDAIDRRRLRRARGGQGGRLVPGPHGVRPARARRPLDPRRCALAGDAEDAQPQGQVPRELPAVRAVGAARGRRRLVRARRRQPLHAAGRRRRARSGGAR